jgi:hypothetical protein
VLTKLLSYATVLIGLVFFVAGSWLFYLQVLQGRKQADAEILSAEMESFEQTDEGTATKMYRSKYEVSYSAEGRLIRQPLRGNLSSWKPQDILERLKKNPVGSRRPLYYVPARPEDVMFDPLSRRIGFSLLFLSIGATIIGFGALLLYHGQPLDW